MDITGLQFNHICDIEPTLNPDGSVQSFMPQNLYRNIRGVLLNRYGGGPFCKFKIPNRHRTSGVYALTVEAQARYVGECENLSSRFNAGYGNISPKNCFKGGQETNCRVNNLVYLSACAKERIELWFHETANHKAAEATLLAALTFSWNRR